MRESLNRLDIAAGDILFQVCDAAGSFTSFVFKSLTRDPRFVK